MEEPTPVQWFSSTLVLTDSFESGEWTLNRAEKDFASLAAAEP
jgi:hypothetical protein